MNILKIIKWSIVIICILIFPVLIERVLFWDKLLFVNIDTKFEIADWFSFWGSYLGSIGTVVLGVIALKQNKTLAEANKDLDNIQKTYFDSISRPTIKIGSLCNFEYQKKGDIRKYFEDNIDTMYPVVLKTFKNNFDDEKCWFTKFELPIISTSDIPLIDFEVADFKWTINGRVYEFENIVSGKSCKLPYSNDYNLCTLCVLYPDLFNQLPDLHQAGEDIQLYIESTMNRTSENRQSRASFDITVRNQLDKSRRFYLELDLYWSTKFQLQINKYFIKPYDV